MILAYVQFAKFLGSFFLEIINAISTKCLFHKKLLLEQVLAAYFIIIIYLFIIGLKLGFFNT